MKKILAAVLAAVMLISGFCVSAASVPEVMASPMLNYSSEADFSMSFDTAEALAEVFKAISGYEDDSGLATVDMESLLKSLLSFKGAAVVKADISEDYNKIMLSMEADYDYGADINPNLSVLADMKMGLWLDLDLTDVMNPKCLAVISSPMSTKYTYIDLFEAVDDESKLMVTAVLKMFLNKEFIDSINAAVVECYEENAEIVYNGKDCTIKLDNDGFLKLMDAMTDLFSTRLQALIPLGQEYPEEHEIIRYADSGIQILGDGGCVIEYREDGTVTEYCDIEININDLCEQIAGETLPLEDALILGFTVTENGKIFDVGTTEVIMPELTEENSIDLYTAFTSQPEEDYYYEEDNYYEEYTPSYPFYYVDVYTDYIPSVNGEIYVPFRATLENAYEGNVNIVYDKGMITVTSDYFEDMQTLTFKAGETKANVDGIEFEVGKIILENGITYVTSDFFEIVFGWSLDWATYDFIFGEYNIGFYTESFDDYYDEW